jgi:cytochrome c556
MTTRAALAIAVGALLGWSQHAGAQRPGDLPQARAQRPQDTTGRARLEGEIRRAFARAARQRVGLSDEQIARLVPMTQRHEQSRRQLQREEREARMALRAMMRDEQTADAAKVDQLLRQLVDIQKRRVQLFESEQREFATVMTPVQRAKFMALQEQVRRRLEQMRQRRAAPIDGQL